MTCDETTRMLGPVIHLLHSASQQSLRLPAGRGAMTTPCPGGEGDDGGICICAVCSNALSAADRINMFHEKGRRGVPGADHPAGAQCLKESVLQLAGGAAVAAGRGLPLGLEHVPHGCLRPRGGAALGPRERRPVGRRDPGPGGRGARVHRRPRQPRLEVVR